jgi:GcrA cell cycle regulator
MRGLYSRIVRRAVLPPGSDGPARLPVLLAGEPRRLFLAHAAAGAPAPAEHRRNEILSEGRKRGDAMAHDADRQALRAARIALHWSEERIALLRQRWAEGLSASSIAKELGPEVSRCAVLGKVHRLKLAQPEFRRHHAGKEKARPHPPPRSKRAGGRGRSRLMAAFCALGLDAFFGKPDTRTVHDHAGKAFGPGCALLDLTAATCRWPVGDPGEADFTFCGAAPFQRYPYCLGHCLIAYRPESSEGEPQRTAAPERAGHGLERAA